MGHYSGLGWKEGNNEGPVGQPPTKPTKEAGPKHVGSCDILIIIGFPGCCNHDSFANSTVREGLLYVYLTVFY